MVFASDCCTDWLGSFTFSLRRRWPMLARAGVEVRCFNPPRFDRALRMGQQRPSQGHYH